MTTPRVSILLPTHNRPETLKWAIESVLAQWMKDFEVLIVADGCTKETAELVATYEDERIRCFDLAKAPNFGYANRNIALKEARGEYIAFMAHDDLWFPDHLEILCEQIEEPHLDLVYSLPLWIDTDGLIAPTPFNLNDEEILKAFLSRERNVLPAGNVLHRRSCFEKVGYWNAELKKCGDWDLWARIIESGQSCNFRYHPIPTCLHFRAIWRQKPVQDPAVVTAFNRVRHVFPSYDRKLRVEVPPGMLEQEATWSKIIKEQGWVKELRKDVACCLDRRNLDVAEYVSEIAHYEAEATNLRTKLIDLGYEFEKPKTRLISQGLGPFCGAGRFMGKEAKLHVFGKNERKTFSLDVVGREEEYYDEFPFELTVSVDGELKEKLRFDKSNQRHHLKMDIPGKCSISLKATTEKENAVRLYRCSIGENHKWSISRALRRYIAQLLDL